MELIIFFIIIEMYNYKKDKKSHYIKYHYIIFKMNRF